MSCSICSQQLLLKFDSVRYNLMSIPFEPKTRSFGRPRLEVDASAENKSISVPRVSPDGRYILYTKGDYGQFHIWHKSSDLWVKDLQTGESYPLAAANSDDADSYHNWASGGRWIVFTSRRDDGLFTRTYFAYFDRDGKAHKAFMLPNTDPTETYDRVLSYNVPEFTVEPIRQSVKTLSRYISEPVVQAKYAE